MAGHGFCLKFWGYQQNQISEKDITALQYYEKGAEDIGEYYNAKKNFVESRGELWTPRNKRPEKLRDNLSSLEDNLKSNEVIFMRWKTQNIVQLVFSSGLLADIVIGNSNDINKIIFDKSATGDITSTSSAIYADHFVCFSFENQGALAYSSLKPDIKLTYVNMPGPKSLLTRNLCLNASEDLLACWWQFGPWIQTANEADRKNVVLFSCSYGRLDVLCSLQTENNITHLEFSKYPNQLLTLEKSYNTRHERHVDVVTYECNKDHIQRLHVISFPLKSGVLSCSRNHDENKVLIGCSDGTINLYDLTIQQLVSSVSRNTIVPTLSMWLGGVIVVASGQGELMTMDSNLNPLALYDMEEKKYLKLELSKYLTSGNGLMQMTNSGNALLLLFNGGPLTVLNILGKLSTIEIIKQHVHNNKLTEAVSLLCSVNWNYEGDQAYQGLMMIVDFILKQPLDHDYEVQLESAFSSFYLSTRPISDAIVLKYRNTISCYARRFFHHLIRYQRFEKAFLLAKDINSADLFMDIYFNAKDVGETKIAKLAKQKADEIIAVESSDSTDSLPDDNHFDGQELEAEDLKEMLDVLDKSVDNTLDASESTSTLKVTNLGYV